ncbi:cytochrome c [Corallincola luteus]|uniref:Cytochrome c n=1 Tax=Corallincola luteus TaxID=1775177 RepID=A0ABY2APN6_9GAMM|nr:cytochrome c [Corallincola luteus]TCI05163.1 cytochrome c [Corallincola luteus]
MYKKTLLSCVAGALLATGGIAVAKESPYADPEPAIEYRQKSFSLIAANFGDLVAMLKGKKEYDAAVAQRRADAVAALSHLPLEAFAVKGSNEGDTKAKPAIWSSWSDFEEKMAALQSASTELAKVAGSGDMDAFKTAIAATGKTCKGCHDDYKNK